MMSQEGGWQSQTDITMMNFSLHAVIEVEEATLLKSRPGLTIPSNDRVINASEFSEAYIGCGYHRHGSPPPPPPL